jgi:hypothetical protein
LLVAYLVKGYLCEWNGNGKIKPGGPIHYPVHQRVWELMRGPIPPGAIVHHRNHNKLDNRIENLILTTRPDHPSLHRWASTDDTRRCGSCEQWKPIEEFHRGQSRCKACARAERREWAAQNPERVAGYNRQRRERYRARQH